MPMSTPSVLSRSDVHVPTKAQRSYEVIRTENFADNSGVIVSTSVTLSNEAMSLSRLSSKGIQVSSGQMSTPLSTEATSAASIPDATQDHYSIGINELKSLLKKMGGEEETITVIAKGLDTDQDQQVSAAEIARGLSETGDDKSSVFAETLRRFMDERGDRSGSVSGHEFLALASSLYAALK